MKILVPPFFSINVDNLIEIPSNDPWETQTVNYPLTSLYIIES